MRSALLSVSLLVGLASAASGEGEGRIASLEKEADELSTYATTASAESARAARSRATERRLEALRLALFPARKTESPDTAHVASLRAALAASGPEAESRAFAIVLERARADGKAALLAALDERLATRAPVLAATFAEHKGRVIVARIADSGIPERKAELADARERRALLKELGEKGLDVVEATGEGARGLGVLTGSLELVLDRRGRVRGVDLAGSERAALVRSLLEERP